MKKVLFISDFLLLDNVGAHKLSMAHLETLQQIYGQSLDIIALTGDRKYTGSKYLGLRASKNKIQKLRNIIQGNTVCISNLNIKVILKEIDKNKYSNIFIDNSIYGKLVKKIKEQNPNVNVISFYHDVKKNLAKQFLKEYGIKYLPVYLATIYNEKLNSQYADSNITLNKRESELLRKYYGINPSIELPIYFNENQEIEVEKYMNTSRDKNILFVGAYYYPNVKGIEWFCENVIPLLKGNYKLKIVGREMEKIRSKINDKHVEVVGGVKDLSRYYNDADIIIGPIFDGAGMKVKTAEAFSYGKIFVGTDESLVGYYEQASNDLKNKFIFKANTKEEFAEKINYLIENYDFHFKFNKPVREYFIENYSSRSALEKLCKLLKEYEK